MKKLRILLASLSLLVVSILPALPAYAAGAPTGSGGEICDAIGDISPSGGDCNNPDGPGPNKVVKLAVNLLSMVAGVIAVIMLIVAGLSYVTSNGDATKLSHAKNTLIYAIVGILVVVFAQLIVKFVLSRVT